MVFPKNFVAAATSDQTLKGGWRAEVFASGGSFVVFVALPGRRRAGRVEPGPANRNAGEVRKRERGTLKKQSAARRGSSPEVSFAGRTSDFTGDCPDPHR
jgi:hypothetical protein